MSVDRGGDWLRRRLADPVTAAEVAAIVDEMRGARNDQASWAESDDRDIHP